MPINNFENIEVSELTIKKNIQFSRLLKLNKKQAEFNFTRLPSLSTESFLIDFTDESGKRCEVKITKQENNWQFDEKNLQPWLYKAQDDLGRIIDRQIKENQT